MNEHDLNLIAAYAAGELDADEAERVSAMLASNPEARAEYDAQLTALAALSSAADSVLSAAERTRLRSAVAAELHLDLEPEVASPRLRPRFAWAKLAPVAAVLVAIVVAAPLLRTLSIGGDGDGTAETAALPATTAASVESDLAGATEPTAAADTTAQAREMESLAQAPASDSDALLAPATTMAPAATTTAPAAPEGATRPVPDLGQLAFADLAPLRASLIDLEIEEASFAAFLYDSSAADERFQFAAGAPLEETCPDTVDELVPGWVVAPFVAIASIEEIPVSLYWIVPPGDGEPILAAFDVACAVIGTAGP